MAADPGARLYVVVPVHDRRELTRRCLLALRRQAYPRSTVVVVDDGSTDGTAAMLRADFPEAVTLAGGGELWWTGAVNLARAWVLERAADDDAFVTLNNDTEPRPDWLQELHSAALAHPRTLVGSVAVAETDGRIESAAVTIDWWRARFSDPCRGLDPARLREQAPCVLPGQVLSGKGTLVPMRALRELGPYASSLPQYGADYEFSLRAARHGWRLLVATGAELDVAAKTGGLHTSPRRDVGWLLRSLWSTRSANAIRYRVRFARLACPARALPVFIALDTGRVVASSVRSFASATAASARSSPADAGRGVADRVRVRSECANDGHVRRRPAWRGRPRERR